MGTLFRAEEARKKTNESSYTLEHISKEISEQAKRNCNTLRWCTYDMDLQALENVKKQLTDAGYSVSTDSEDDETLIIRW